MPRVQCLDEVPASGARGIARTLAPSQTVRGSVDGVRDGGECVVSDTSLHSQPHHVRRAGTHTRDESVCVYERLVHAGCAWKNDLSGLSALYDLCTEKPLIGLYALKSTQYSYRLHSSQLYSTVLHGNATDASCI